MKYFSNIWSSAPNTDDLQSIEHIRKAADLTLFYRNCRSDQWLDSILSPDCLKIHKVEHQEYNLIKNISFIGGLLSERNYLRPRFQILTTSNNSNQVLIGFFVVQP